MPFVGIEITRRTKSGGYSSSLSIGVAPVAANHIFTGSDFSMPVSLVQGEIVPIHCVNTILLCHLATLCMGFLVSSFLPLWKILYA